MQDLVVSCSMAFRLHVTATLIAIVYGARQVPIQEMVRDGLFLNIVGSFVIAACVLFFMSR